VDMRALKTPYLFLFLASGLLAQQPPARAENTLFNPNNNVILVEDRPVYDIAGRSSTVPIENIPEESLRLGETNDLTRLNTIPGIQVREIGSPTVSIRGSQRTGRTLTLIEDTPANFGDGAGLYPLFVPTEALDSAGLLRAPGAHIWGQESLAGALVFRMREFTAPTAKLRIGSQNTRSAFAGAPLLSKNSEWKAQATAFQEYSETNQPRSDRETLRATARAHGKIGPVQIKTSHVFVRQIGSIPASRLMGSSPDSFANRGSISSLGVASPLVGDLGVASRTSYRQLTLDDSSGKSRVESFGQGLSTVYSSNPLSFEIFSDYSGDKLETPFLNNAGAARRDTVESGTLAGLKLTPQSHLQIGAHTTTAGGSALLSAGMSTVTAEGWLAFANYAEGYHPPSLFDKYVSSGSFVGNPDLKPEKSEQIDLGCSRQWPDTKLSLQFFQRETRDLITLQQIGVTTTYNNISRALATGGEAMLTHQWDDWSSSIGAGYLENRGLDPDTPLPLSPKIQIGANIERRLNKWTLSIQETVWSSYYSSLSTPELPGWATTDFFAKYTINDRLKAEGSVLNIFNKDRELTFGYPEPGAQFFLALEGAF